MSQRTTKGETMTTDTIKHLGAEFHRAADSLADTLAHLDNARLDRLAFLRRCSKDSTARLAAIKEELRTLPEQIAKWDAEAARLESQTAEDLLRQALDARKCDGDHIGPICADKQCWLRCPDCGQGEHYPAACGAVVLHPQPPGEVIEAPLTQPKPEPYRAGLPRPVENCGHVAADGTCGHPNAQTPECHDGVVCPVKAGKVGKCSCAPGRTTFTICDYCKSSLPAGLWTRFASTGHPQRAEASGEIERFLSKTAAALLDLTKLPPGTVCEALEDIPRWNGRTVAAGVRFTLIDTSTEEGDEFPMVVTTNGENSYCIPALVPARVVKEGGEDAPR